MRVLVLGGTRFIGRAIVDVLVADHEVTVLNRGTRPLLDKRVRQLRADRCDPAAVSAVLSGTYDAVVDVSGTRPLHVETVLDAVRAMKVPSYVFISSAGVYDRTRVAPPFREEDPSTGDPIWGEYGTAKSACERLLQAAVGSRLTVLRPPYVYGPGNNEQREQFLWARMLAGRPIFVPGDGSARIQFCHAGDLAQTVLSAVQGTLPRGVYNVAEPQTYSFAEYIGILAQVPKAPARTVSVHDPAVPAREYFPFRQAELTLDVGRIAAVQPDRFRPLRLGLSETYEWFNAAGLLTDEPTAQEATWRAGGAGAPRS